MKSKELQRIEQFINEGKHDEALQLMKDFEEKGDTPSNGKLSCQLLKCEFFFQQGSYEKVIKLSEEIYEESLRLGRNLFSFDALFYKADSLLWVFKLDETLEIIKKGEDQLKILTNESTIIYKHREARLIFLKGRYYALTYKIDYLNLSIEHFENSLSLHKEFGMTRDIITTLLAYALVISSGAGELDRALKYTEEGLKLAEDAKNKYLIAMAFRNLMIIYTTKGEFDLGLSYAKKSFRFFEDINNKPLASRILTQIGECYRLKGEYKLALEYLERALVLQEELRMTSPKSTTIVTMVEVAVAMGDLEFAQQYLKQLEQLNEQKENKFIELMFRHGKALILKTSLRATDRAKAEIIFKEIIDEYEDDFSVFDDLINLCDLLLFELKITSDLEVLKEIESYVSQLLTSAEKSNSFWVLGEVYLLQAKLALIRLDLNGARRLLTQGQQIAEKHNLTLLAMKISNEHDNLFKEIGKWEYFKQTKASLEKRMKLSHLSEQLEGMVNKRVVEPIDLIDEEPVVLLIVSKHGTPVFSKSFEEEWSFQDHLFGGFLSAVNSFSDEMFSEGLDRATFGQYTILMKSIPPFSVCYLFKGQTYPAQQKMKYFIEKLLNEKKIWQTLHDFYRTNREVQSKDIPSLEPLLTDIFINKKFPSNRLESII